MARTRREEERLLTTDERELVSQAHQPQVKGLSDGALRELLGRLRERRDRARGIAQRQRREMRGKGQPAGATSATDNSGTQEKAQVLAAAVKRLNKEAERRRQLSARDELAANARRALAMKQGAGEPSYPLSRRAGRGMHPVANERIAPSGAFDAEGHRPVLERSRKVR